MTLKEPGQVEKLKGVIKDIRFEVEQPPVINLWIDAENNTSSLSYLSIDEAVHLRNELNAAIKEAVGV